MNSSNGPFLPQISDKNATRVTNQYNTNTSLLPPIKSSSSTSYKGSSTNISDNNDNEYSNDSDLLVDRKIIKMTSGISLSKALAFDAMEANNGNNNGLDIINGNNCNASSNGSSSNDSAISNGGNGSGNSNLTPGQDIENDEPNDNNCG